MDETVHTYLNGLGVALFKPNVKMFSAVIRGDMKHTGTQLDRVLVAREQRLVQVYNDTYFRIASQAPIQSFMDRSFGPLAYPFRNDSINYGLEQAERGGDQFDYFDLSDRLQMGWGIMEHQRAPK